MEWGRVGRRKGNRPSTLRELRRDRQMDANGVTETLGTEKWGQEGGFGWRTRQRLACYITAGLALRVGEVRVGIRGKLLHFSVPDVSVNDQCVVGEGRPVGAVEWRPSIRQPRVGAQPAQEHPC